MAYSYTEFAADGNTSTFTVPFDYVKQTEVRVYVDGVETTDFVFTSANAVNINSTPPAGVVVRIGRETDITTRAVDFEAGAVLTEEDLDTALIQVFNAAQEAYDTVQASMFKDPDGKFNAQGRIIKNVDNPTDAQDVVTKTYLEDTWLSPTDKINCATVQVNTGQINTVSSNITKVQNLDTNMQAIENLHNNMSRIQNLYANRVQIENLHLNMSDINVVDANMADINTVADHILDVNSYADTYYIAPVAPVGGIVEGAQWYNTTNQTKYIYNGSYWQAYNTSTGTEFVGFKVTADGNLEITYGQGAVDTSEYYEWFMGMSDATYSIDSDGHFKVTY